MNALSVECTFAANGTVRVHRVEIGGRWQVAEQGRQWMDENGRHILILLPDSQVHELLFSAQTLSWQLLPGRSRTQVIV